MKRSIRAMAGVVAAVAMVGGGASVAEAVVTGVDDPAKVVVDSPVPSFWAFTKTNTTLNGKHYASFWMTSPVSGRLLFLGDGGAESSEMRIQGDVDAAQVAPYWGKVAAEAVDDVDGRSTPFTLDVRRKSRVFMSKPTVLRGRVSFLAEVQHYDGGVTEKYIESQKSPVQLQELVPHVGWVLRAKGVTDGAGSTTLSTSLSPGRHRYRVYRPNGATVWAAVSLSRIAG